jgi:signal peptidase I
MHEMTETTEPSATAPGAQEDAAQEDAARADAQAGEDAPAPSETNAPQPATETPKVSESEKESWGEVLKTLVYALLIALVIRTFLFQPFYIPSASMEGTLLIGDYLFVEKYAYGYSNYSLPWGKLFPTFGRIFGGEPHRGDVVVFKMPNPLSPDYQKDYIKRVIGLPGDRIQMINDRLYINDKIVPETRAADYIETVDGYTYHVPRYLETLPGGKTHYILDRTPDGPADNTDVFVVPPGDYFMMGDNRDNSDDSRGDVGYVPAVNLVGKAELRFFSIDSGAVWYEPWTWFTAIRYSRMFTFID